LKTNLWGGRTHCKGRSTSPTQKQNVLGEENKLRGRCNYEETVQVRGKRSILHKSNLGGRRVGRGWKESDAKRGVERKKRDISPKKGEFLTGSGRDNGRALLYRKDLKKWVSLGGLGNGPERRYLKREGSCAEPK